MRQKFGRIIAVGMTKEVAFEAVAGPINDCIDDGLPCKVPSQPVPQPNDQRTCPLGNGEDHAERDESIKLSSSPTSIA
jgi:hypothetical protein